MCILCIISFGSVVSSLTKRKYSMAEKRQSSSQKRLMQDLFTDKRWINCWAPRFLFNMPKKPSEMAQHSRHRITIHTVS